MITATGFFPFGVQGKVTGAHLVRARRPPAVPPLKLLLNLPSIDSASFGKHWECYSLVAVPLFHCCGKRGQSRLSEFIDYFNDYAKGLRIAFGRTHTAAFGFLFLFLLLLLPLYLFSQLLSQQQQQRFQRGETLPQGLLLAKPLAIYFIFLPPALFFWNFTRFYNDRWFLLRAAKALVCPGHSFVSLWFLCVPGKGIAFIVSLVSLSLNVVLSREGGTAAVCVCVCVM